jgi:hypothetical protein
MSEEKIASDKRASTLHAFERSLFGICTMSVKFRRLVYTILGGERVFPLARSCEMGATGKLFHAERRSRKQRPLPLKTIAGGGVVAKGWFSLYIRERSCLLLCSLLLKALLQNWHLYLRSGARDAFRDEGVEAAGGGRTATLAPGILMGKPRVEV